MSDPSEVREIYGEICRENGGSPHPFIVQQLDGMNVHKTPSGFLLALPGNNQLLTKVRLEDNDMPNFCAALHKTFCITEIDLRYNNLTDQCTPYLAALFKESTTLKAINLMCNYIESDGASALAESLHDNSSLKLLKLNGNKIGNKGGMSIAGMLQINNGLEVIDLNDCDLGMESVIALATVLRSNKFVASLNVSRPLLFSVQEETTVHMGLMLRVNTTLTHLHLIKCDMRDFGVERLADGLYENTSLKYLNLACNRITRDGTKHLAKLLEKNQTLEAIELGENRLEDDGAIFLANALATNFTLRCLSVVSNQIKGPGLVKLAEILDINSTLEQLYIWGNIFEPAACEAFKKLLDRARLREEDIDVRYYEADGQVYLSELSHGLRTYYYYTPQYGEDSKINQKSLLDNFYGSPVNPAVSAH